MTPKSINCHHFIFTGVTPLMLVAMSSGNCKTAELLLGSGADPSIKNALGQDAAELALATGNCKLFLLLNQSSPSLEGVQEKVKNTNPDYIDSMFTTNKMCSEVPEDIVLKNSPNCPVFKTGNPNISVNCDNEKLLFSPSKRSVFLPSLQKKYWDSDEPNCQCNLEAIVTPRKFMVKTPNTGKKRKLSTVSGISSWFKKIKKR